MKKNVYLKRTVGIVSIILALVLCTLAVQNLFFSNRDANSMRVQGFYLEEKDSLDVVFLGASDVFAGYSAALAYEDYGYTSYPFVIDSSSVTLWKSQLKEIYSRQSPQMIVIEINGVLYEDEKDIFKDAGVRYYVENMPLTANKIETISSLQLEDDVPSYYFPIIKYHSNWNNPEFMQRSFENLKYLGEGPSKLKGFFSYSKYETDNKLIKINDPYKCSALNEIAEKYLIEFLDYCKENKIDNIVFTRFPHRITTEGSLDRYYRCNEAEKIIKEYGFDFLNYERDNSDIGIDFDSDFYNDDHLNVTGAVKMTNYLGKVLTDFYGIKGSALSNNNTKNWEKSSAYVKRFVKYVEQCHNDNIEKWLSESPELISILDTFG